MDNKFEKDNNPDFKFTKEVKKIKKNTKIDKNLQSDD